MIDTTDTASEQLAHLLDDATDITTGTRHTIDIAWRGETITLRFVSRQARDEALNTLDTVLAELMERGRCDTCGHLYGLADRDGRCGDCGECADHCRH